MILVALLLMQAAPALARAEPVDPYEIRDANAGARPFAGTDMIAAFHGQAGVRRIADDLVVTLIADLRISDIFKGQDHARLRRTLFEQFCYILGGHCRYTGRDMARAHQDLGIQRADLNALVEDLQAAMTREGVSFSAQNKFLAKLAPMRRDVVTR